LEKADYIIENELTGYQPIGKVTAIEFSANRQLVAIYTDPDVSGTIVMIDVARNMFLLTHATQIEAQSMTWCGTDCLVLTEKECLHIVGRERTVQIDVECSTEGILCRRENDGLRIVTSDCTYFLELVSEAAKLTLGYA
jgi:hypothetical protein